MQTGTVKYIARRLVRLKLSRHVGMHALACHKESDHRGLEDMDFDSESNMTNVFNKITLAATWRIG